MNPQSVIDAIAHDPNLDEKFAVLLKRHGHVQSRYVFPEIPPPPSCFAGLYERGEEPFDYPRGGRCD